MSLTKYRVRLGGRAVVRAVMGGREQSAQTQLGLWYGNWKREKALSLHLCPRNWAHGISEGLNTGSIPVLCCSLFQAWETTGSWLASSGCQLPSTRGLWKPIKFFYLPLQSCLDSKKQFHKKQLLGFYSSLFCFVLLFGNRNFPHNM